MQALFTISLNNLLDYAKVVTISVQQHYMACSLTSLVHFNSVLSHSSDQNQAGDWNNGPNLAHSTQKCMVTRTGGRNWWPN